MQLIGNILWFTIGSGFLTGTAWVIFGAIAYVSIVGILPGNNQRYQRQVVQIKLFKKIGEGRNAK